MRVKQLAECLTQMPDTYLVKTSTDLLPQLCDRNNHKNNNDINRILKGETYDHSRARHPVM